MAEPKKKAKSEPQADETSLPEEVFEPQAEDVEVIAEPDAEAEEGEIVEEPVAETLEDEQTTVDDTAPEAMGLDETEKEIEEAVEAIASDLSDDNPDKVEEYFSTKRVIKDLRAELKEFKENHKDALEAEKINKQLKLLRDKIKNQTEIKILTDKIANLTERLELLKEIIKVQLLELEVEEIKYEGKKLKLVKVLKEMRDQEETETTAMK
jgi:hypothetical protein